MGVEKRRVVILTPTQHQTPTLQAPDQGQDHPYAQRRLADTRLHARDRHHQGDAHEAQPTRDHRHHQGVGGVLRIPQLGPEMDPGVHLVVPGISRVSEGNKIADNDLMQVIQLRYDTNI